MSDLERVRKDTENIAEESEREYKKAVKSHTKLILIIAVAVICAIAGLLMYVKIDEGVSEAKRSAEIKKEIEFRNKYFGELDELYEAGDDAALTERINELMDEDGYGAIYDWSHYPYCRRYDKYMILKHSADNIASGHYTDDDIEMALESALSLLYDEYYAVDATKESPEKAEVIRRSEEEAHAFLSERLGLTPDEERELLEKCSEGGYLSYAKVKKVLPEVKERAGI